MRSLDQHRENSSQHNRERFQKFFKSSDAKKKHIKTFPQHGLCKRDFETKKASQLYHKRSYPIPTKHDGIFATKSVPVGDVAYVGIPPIAVKPVSCHRKLHNQWCSSATLPPLDNTPEGIQWRQEKQRMKEEQARLAETEFTNTIRNLGYVFQTEAEQKESMISPTPDVRFLDPIPISGHLCFWLEYKNYFGFKANPFIASQNKTQLKKYIAKIGPGGVVFRLGFETDHLNIKGVKAFHEEDLLQCLRASIFKVA
ncbi:hypothetical protein RJZ57_006811 [Blastomyces gilchristii]